MKIGKMGFEVNKAIIIVHQIIYVPLVHNKAC